MLIKELYQNCFTFEYSLLAHYIHHLLSEQKISLDDDVSLLDIANPDDQKVRELILNNALGIHKVCVYSLKMNEKDFVFIFAATQQEAIQFYLRTYNQFPLNIHEYTLDFQFTRGNETISFRDIRKEIGHFPAIAGYFKRE